MVTILDYSITPGTIPSGGLITIRADVRFGSEDGGNVVLSIPDDHPCHFITDVGPTKRLEGSCKSMECGFEDTVRLSCAGATNVPITAVARDDTGSDSSTRTVTVQ